MIIQQFFSLFLGKSVYEKNINALTLYPENDIMNQDLYQTQNRF